MAAGSTTSGASTILSLRAITRARWPSAVCASARFRATLAKSRIWRIRTQACDHSDLLLRFLRESPLTSLEPTAGCSRDSRRAPRFVNAVFSPTLLNYGSRPIALPRAHYDTPLFILQFGLCESLPRGPRRIRSVGNGSLRELPREIVLPRSVQRETFAIRVGPPRASGSLLFSPLRLFIGIGQSGGQNGCALCSGSSR